MSLVLTALTGMPIIQPGDSIPDEICLALKRENMTIESGDIFVIAQKIISKAEGRFVDLSTVKPSGRALALAKKTSKDPRFIELVLKESKCVLRTRVGTIIVEHRLGFVCANAGIDHSNVQNLGGKPEDWVLLLPENPDTSANRIRRELEERSGASIGVIIIDSHGRAWRNGTVGVSIGVSGVPAIVDFRGKEDLFGYQLRVTQVAAADELGAAASLLMGQAAEGTPVIHVRGFPFELRESEVSELIRPKEMDLFR